MTEETYPLPSNGWRPGMPSHMAARPGRFHAELTDQGAPSA